MLNSRNSTSCLNSSNARSSRERKNCLKRALQQTLVLQEVANGSTINKLDEAINEVDHVTSETSIEEKVSNQQEVLIDSQMMTSSSKVLKTCTISLTKRMRDYDHIDFSQKLVKHLQETSGKSQSPNWSLLERRVTKLFKRIANSSTLLGTLDPLEKKIIVRKKPEQRVASQPAVTVPDKLVPHANTKDEDSVERTVRKIKKLITCYCKEAGKPLDFFQLILHPHDFGRTIRNMLYISFLVKDGVMKLKKDQRSLVVEPYHKEINSQQKRSSNRMGIQNVTSLNMKQWRILKKAYRLEQPMIDFDEEK
ncbi:non-structural maintenance of chromosomes element 4 homolog A [Temnothorax nylanderi]|uniref:non-structural maintenance of chromosomes element 4 homolog A n=1 Tax=Temnothorax nylanderi TaxID=102681 RepID=UPI003A86BF04